MLNYYEVIGIIGDKRTRSLIDYSIYVNLDSFSEVNNDIGLYHLDGMSDKSVRQTIEQFNMNLKLIDTGKYGILNVFYRHVPAVSLFVSVRLAFISFFIFFSYEWFRSRHKLNEAMTVIGMSRREKFKEIFPQYFLTILPSLTLVIIGFISLFTVNKLAKLR